VKLNFQAQRTGREISQDTQLTADVDNYGQLHILPTEEET